jgi:hypothetical protein
VGSLALDSREPLEQAPFRPSAAETRQLRANTWSDYATALACVRAGQPTAYLVLTAGDGLGMISTIAGIRKHRDDMWAQLLLMRSGATYVEVSPSGKGLHIWGTAAGGPES